MQAAQELKVFISTGAVTCGECAVVNARRCGEPTSAASTFCDSRIGSVSFFRTAPPTRSTLFAEHACLKYSGRVGRSVAAKDLAESAVRLAVVEHVRHVETPYVQLLAAWKDRHEARRQVENQVDDVLSRWERAAPRPA